MSNIISRVRRAVAAIPADSRPQFERVDASSARYDDGSWLEPSVTA